MWSCYALIGCLVPCLNVIAAPAAVILVLMAMWSMTQAATSLAAAKNRG
jgi:hypothetical protein